MYFLLVCVYQDKDRTRNLAEKSEKKAFEEARKRLHMEKKDKKALIPDLRERARKDYVRERKTKKVDSLREEIEEDERMFDENSLTEKEKLERQYKKKVYSLICILLHNEVLLLIGKKKLVRNIKTRHT